MKAEMGQSAQLARSFRQSSFKSLHLKETAGGHGRLVRLNEFDLPGRASHRHALAGTVPNKKSPGICAGA
jgi:hypothetical protein